MGLIALLYWGTNTVPPAPKTSDNTATNTGAAGQQPPHMNIEPASFDSILSASRAALPEHAVEEVVAIEQTLSSMSDSNKMIPLIKDLSDVWKQHKQPEAATYYFAKAAKLENSEKNLNFAGHLFMTLARELPKPDVRMWAAQEAVDCYQRSLNINPDNDTIKMSAAAAYIDGTGETMSGVQILLGIVREDPDNVAANLMLGQLSIRSAQYEKAAARFDAVLKQKPDDVEALYFRAVVYKETGNKEKAKELLERCKKLVDSEEFSKDIDRYINSF